MNNQKLTQTHRIIFTIFCIFLLSKMAFAAGEWVILQKQAPYEIPYDLEGVCFVDESNGWIAGEAIFEDMKGFIAHTENGGATWEQQESASKQALSDICFVDKKHGWAVGSKGMIVHTTNGQDWERQISGQDNALYGLHFVNKNVGYAVGMNKTILKTNNGGGAWDILKGGTIPSNLGETENVIYNSVYFISEKIGWAVGVHIVPEGQQNGAVHYTTDGGKTWKAQTTNVTDILKDVYFVDANKGWVVGENGVILYTEDAGKTWTSQKSGTQEHLRSVSFADAENGWAIGGARGILPVTVGTTDGGKTWTPYKGLDKKLEDANVYMSLNSVDAIGPKDYWSVGQGGIILGSE